MQNNAESFAQKLRGLRHGSLAWLPLPLYRTAKSLAMASLDLLSRGSGRSVKVAGVYPLQVEWERSAIDFTTWEAEFTSAFGKALSEPKVVLDIGASLGEWSALAATLVGSENVHVFEPNLASWQNIEKIFKLNRLGITAGVFPGFAANVDKFDTELLINARSRRWPVATKGPTDFEHLLNPKNLPMIKLDTYCRDLNVAPAVIKIDVEGAEGDVLRGAQKVLEEYRPLVFLSLHPWALSDFGDSKSGLLRWLEEKGYNCTLLAVDHEEHWYCVGEG